MRATAIYIPGSSSVSNGGDKTSSAHSPSLRRSPKTTEVEDEGEHSRPLKIRRLEDQKQQVTAENTNEGSIAPIHATKLILQGVLSFFRKHPPTPQLPRPQFEVAANKLHERHACLVTDTEAEKENIPLSDLPKAVTLLEKFREGVLAKQRRGEVPPPPPGARRLAPRHFSEQMTGKKAKVEVRKPSRGERGAVEGTKNSALDQCGKPRKAALIRRRSLRLDSSATGRVQVTREHLAWFLQLVEEPRIHQFLTTDICRRYADKYLLAMVFTYFVRARFQAHQYTRENFFAALYLAHDMEEDEEELKYEVFPWVLGPRWRRLYPRLIKLRDSIFWTIDCRAVVSRRCCDQVMGMEPHHWLWQRERPTYHAGAFREHGKHPSDNGQPRGPDNSPLQCQLCLERECAASQSSYLLYLSESEDSPDVTCLDGGQTIEHKEKDSGFETFLCGHSDTSLVSSTSQNGTKMVIKGEDKLQATEGSSNRSWARQKRRHLPAHPNLSPPPNGVHGSEDENSHTGGDAGHHQAGEDHWVSSSQADTLIFHSRSPEY